ncbi:MAG: rRNA pseudouridine synthase [Verrucomicrobiaceae bacterium]|nr:rRNA pseudouridine synthase [Verrucomicrobiaceae bacterium]
MKPQGSRHGLARALSKLGYCSRSEANRLILAGRVSLNGRVRRDPDTPTRHESDVIAVDGSPVVAAARFYLMLNKPRGYVTTAKDELERETIFDLLPNTKRQAHLSAVGRLDKASEGLLLLTNDNDWAARLTDPSSHVDKVYHVQINAVADDAMLKGMTTGVDDLRAKSVSVIRSGGKTCWLEVVLDEGKNRHIRRLLESLGQEVLRLVRVQIGPLKLGELPKGQIRELTAAEVKALA